MKQKIVIDHKDACGQTHTVTEYEILKKEYQGEVFTLVFFVCPVLGPSVADES